MGQIIQTCQFCFLKQTEENPVLIIKSFGKHNNQKICFDCLKKKIKAMERFERRMHQTS